VWQSIGREAWEIGRGEEKGGEVRVRRWHQQTVEQNVEENLGFLLTALVVILDPLHVLLECLKIDLFFLP